MKKTKLLESIDAKLTGNKAIVDEPLWKIEYDESTREVLWNYATEYRVGVNLGNTFLVQEDDLKKNPNLIEMQKDRMRVALADAVYGEVRSELIELTILLRQSGAVRYGDESLKKLDDVIEMISGR